MAETKRPTIDEYFLDIARDVSKRGTCLRRRFGAVIVREGTIVSSGYVGAPRGSINCTDTGECARTKLGIEPGTRYELCESVHAEMNAVINAARSGVSVLGGALYLHGENVDGCTPVKGIAPCKMCSRVLINAGIERVIAREADGTIVSFFAGDLLRFSRSEGKEGY